MKKIIISLLLMMFAIPCLAEINLGNGVKLTNPEDIFKEKRAGIILPFDKSVALYSLYAPVIYHKSEIASLSFGGAYKSEAAEQAIGFMAGPMVNLTKLIDASNVLSFAKENFFAETFPNIEAGLSTVFMFDELFPLNKIRPIWGMNIAYAF